MQIIDKNNRVLFTPMMKSKLMTSVLQSRWTLAVWVIMVILWLIAAYFIAGVVAQQRQSQLIHREHCYLSSAPTLPHRRFRMKNATGNGGLILH